MEVQSRQQRVRRIVGGVATGLLAMLALSVSAAAAQPPYEPNDSLLTGYGPLANNTTYTATLETENDKDYYYFYVTTASTAQLTFTLTNLGGGSSSITEVRGAVTDSHGSYVSSISSGVETSNYATKSVSLSAGKYYVVIENDYGYGESYRLVTSGTDGAFGEYATIAANCAAATAPVSTYQAQLAAAEVKLKKAEVQLRQAQHSRKRRVRRRASVRYRHVKSVVTAEKASLKTAEAGQKPWCFIPA
jgi:hypothetical protein